MPRKKYHYHTSLTTTQVSLPHKSHYHTSLNLHTHLAFSPPHSFSLHCFPTCHKLTVWNSIQESMIAIWS